jgi:hypothetical protein
VLAEGLPVVAENNKDRVLVEPEILVLIEEALQEDVLEADGVEVAVEILVLGEPFLLVSLRHHVRVVGSRSQIGGQEGLSRLFLLR